jgi:hypothetical protein
MVYTLLVSVRAWEATRELRESVGGGTGLYR